MANYDLNSIVQFGRLKEFGAGIKTELDSMKLVSAGALKSVNVDGNKIKFFTSSDKTGTAAFEVDFPTELYLDGVQTTFAPSFEFKAATYAGAENPNLDGKPVLVLAIKDTQQGKTPTYTYSFVNLEALIDTYKIKEGDSAKVLSIDSGTNEIEFKLSAKSGNKLTIENDGLMVDVSDKADKDADSVAGNVAVFDENHNPVDSGHAFATTADVNELIAELFPSE